MELLFTVGNQIGAAIEKSLILEETKRQSNDLRRSFRRVTKALSASVCDEPPANLIIELAAELLKVDRAVLYRVVQSDLKKQNLEPISSYGFKLPEYDVTMQDVKEISAEIVARKRRAIMIEKDAINDARFEPSKLIMNKVAKASFYLALPLVIGNQTVAVIEVFAREPKKVSRSEMRNVLAFAAQAAIVFKSYWLTS
jgi:GAF domain-containing protein